MDRVLTNLCASWFVMAHFTLLQKASITRWTEFWPPFVLHCLLWLTLPSYQRPLSLGWRSSDHPSCFIVCYGSRYPPTKGLYHKVDGVLTTLRASLFVMAHVTLLPKASITRLTEFWPPFVLHCLLWLTLPSYHRPLSLGGRTSYCMISWSLEAARLLLWSYHSEICQASR